MIINDLHFVTCPDCSGTLEENDCGEALICTSCQVKFPIENHVLSLFRSKDRLLQQSNQEHSSFNMSLKNAKNWSYQFGNKFQVNEEMLNEKDGIYGQTLFFKFSGLEPKEVKDKVVLVSCGGTGREAWHLLKAGAKKVIIIDIGDHIYTLTQLLKNDLDKILLIRCDATFLPLKSNLVDIAICDHALQHIPDHKLAFKELVRVTKPDQVISVCVYSYENNFLMIKIIEPMKVILHKLPLGILLFLALFPALLLFCMFKIETLINVIFRPGPMNISKKLPFYELLACWDKNGIYQYWSSCFDLIHAPVSYHFKEAEVLSLSKYNNLKISRIELINNSMWNMVARKVTQMR